MKALQVTLPAAVVIAGILAACASDGGSSSDPSAPGSTSPGSTDPGSPSGKSNDSGSTDPGTPTGKPGLPTGATEIPAEPQKTDGDPDEGYRALVNDGYISIGVPWNGFSFAMSDLQDRDKLPGRTGKNALISYAWTVSTNADGMEIVAFNCLSCHATHVNGKLVVGLGRQDRSIYWSTSGMVSLTNSALITGGLTSVAEYKEWQLFGTRLLTTQQAGQNVAFGAQAAHRDPKTLAWSSSTRFDASTGMSGWTDIPPWWRVKKKNALYATGMGRGDQTHHMTNMTIFSVADVAELKKIEKTFVDVAAYIRSIEPPKFPGKTDAKLVAAGETVFNANCAKCHGTYGKNETYPNLLIDAKVVGTDPELATKSWVNDAAAKWWADSEYGNGSRYELHPGYVPPPLDGIWATAPFLHNGSVPTLEALLDSSKRPSVWSSAFGDDEFDLDAVGWKTGTGDAYDTTKPGGSNAGHLYGDALADDERRAVLEYLKTL
jgi:mono/diheme cytochrome c family protein